MVRVSTGKRRIKEVFLVLGKETCFFLLRVPTTTAAAAAAAAAAASAAAL